MWQLNLTFSILWNLHQIYLKLNCKGRGVTFKCSFSQCFVILELGRSGELYTENYMLFRNYSVQGVQNLTLVISVKKGAIPNKTNSLLDYIASRKGYWRNTYFDDLLTTTQSLSSCLSCLCFWEFVANPALALSLEIEQSITNYRDAIPSKNQEET